MEFSYEEVADFLYSEAASCSPAALQGALVGALVREPELKEAAAVRVATAWLSLDPLPDSLRELVVGLFAKTQASLRDPELSFTLMIPSEGSGIGSRLAAVADWCAAFYPEAQARGQWDEDATSALADIEEIAELDPAAPADEDSERDFVELVEYVRVVVFNLHAASTQDSASARAAPLH